MQWDKLSIFVTNLTLEYAPEFGRVRVYHFFITGQDNFRSTRKVQMSKELERKVFHLFEMLNQVVHNKFDIILGPYSWAKEHRIFHVMF
jgi:hypothetical protein